MALSHPAPTAGDSRSFAGIFIVAYLALLPIAFIAQALQLPWRNWFPGAEAERSLFGGVRAAVYTAMSHLN